MHDADAELALACKAGDSSALEKLYWRHAQRTWRYARHFSGSDEAAAEIVQEVFVRVARHVSAYEGRAQFSTWLFAIVRSAAVEFNVKRRRAPQPVKGELMERMPAKTLEPQEELAAAETRQAVRDAVARLPENEREAVLLCELEDLPLREAGEILGWSESRVKVTLFRARRKLKGLLAAYVGVEAAH